MKKFSLLFTIACLLFSCSKDENDEAGKPKQGEEEITHVVPFQISGFSYDEALSKSGEESGGLVYSFAILIYKENGELFIKKDQQITISPDGHGTVTIEEELPLGNYYVSFLTKKTTNAGFPFYLFGFDNYFTSYYTNEPGNKGLYYGNTSFTVLENAEANKPVSLSIEPMWSEINVTITNIATANIPQVVIKAGMFVVPKAIGFSFSTKKPYMYHNPASGEGDYLLIDKFRSTSNYNLAVTEHQNAKIIIHYNWGDGASEDLIYRGDIKRGMKYTFIGEIGSKKEPAESSFEMKIEDL